MSSILTNFVAVRKTRGDLLTPAEFQSFVAAVDGLLAHYDLDKLRTEYQTFIAHLRDVNNPHHDGAAGFYTEVLTRVYRVYAKMVNAPLNFDQFKAQIVPGLGFLELLRRIVLNRYLFNTVKTSDETIPSSANALLSDDWGVRPINRTQTTIGFGTASTDEDGFLRLGRGVNTQPIPVVFNGNYLSSHPTEYPMLFQTSSVSPYFDTALNSAGYTVALPLASNDVTLDLQVVGTPTTTVPILRLTNTTDTVQFFVNTEGTVQVTVNGTVATAALPCFSGRAIISFNKAGSLLVRTTRNAVWEDWQTALSLTSKMAFVLMQLQLGVETPTAPAFSFREVSVYRGSLIGL